MGHDTMGRGGRVGVVGAVSLHYNLDDHSHEKVGNEDVDEED